MPTWPENVLGATHSDGISAAILTSELAAAYEALCVGRAGPDLPPLPVQYADFAAWQRARLDGGALEAQVRSVEE